MKHVSIVVPKGDAVVGSIEGPYKVLSHVNDFRAQFGLEPLFKVQLVAAERQVSLNHGLFTLRIDHTLDEDFDTDLIIIPAPHGDFGQIIADNAGLVDWIRRQHQRGAEVASLCMGAFLLAATGLMEGRRMATHWLAANDFRRLFPTVHLMDERVITDEQGLYSSGGAYSYLNLVLYLIEKFAGHEIAVLTAKIYQIDMDRATQSPFTIFRGLKEHEDEPIKKAQSFIESNYAGKITIDELAGLAYIGKRNFERRFKKATSNTVAEYIQRVKIEAAKMGLESGRDNVAEVMYKVGYTDDKAFRRTFRKITGLSPAEYRSKYAKLQVPATFGAVMR